MSEATQETKDAMAALLKSLQIQNEAGIRVSITFPIDFSDDRTVTLESFVDASDPMVNWRHGRPIRIMCDGRSVYANGLTKSEVPDVLRYFMNGYEHFKPWAKEIRVTLGEENDLSISTVAA